MRLFSQSLLSYSEYGLQCKSACSHKFALTICVRSACVRLLKILFDLFACVAIMRLCYLQVNLCQKHLFSHQLTPCFVLVVFMYWTGKSMNNLLSYCGLVDPRISASEKDLPVLLGNRDNSEIKVLLTLFDLESLNNVFISN